MITITNLLVQASQVLFLGYSMFSHNKVPLLFIFNIGHTDSNVNAGDNFNIDLSSFPFNAMLAFTFIIVLSNLIIKFWYSSADYLLMRLYIAILQLLSPYFIVFLLIMFRGLSIFCFFLALNDIYYGNNNDDTSDHILMFMFFSLADFLALTCTGRPSFALTFFMVMYTLLLLIQFSTVYFSIFPRSECIFALLWVFMNWTFLINHFAAMAAGNETPFNLFMFSFFNAWEVYLSSSLIPFLFSAVLVNSFVVGLCFFFLGFFFLFMFNIPSLIRNHFSTTSLTSALLGIVVGSALPFLTGILPQWLILLSLWVFLGHTFRLTYDIFSNNKSYKN